MTRTRYESLTHYEFVDNLVMPCHPSTIFGDSTMTYTDSENIRVRRQWYSDPWVKKQIIGEMQRYFRLPSGESMFGVREMVFLDKHTAKNDGKLATRRLMLAHSESFYDSNMERFRFFDSRYALFHSLMFFDRLPIAKFVLADRMIQHKEWFGERNRQYTNGDCKKHYLAYELTLDLDGNADDMSGVIKDTLKLSSLLDEWNTPYAIKFSGSKGFHVTIPVRYFLTADIGWTPEAAVEMCAVFAGNLKENFGISSIDEGIYDEMRLMRVPYSLDTNKMRHNIVMPMSVDEVKRFSFDMVRVDKYLDDIQGNFRYRGYCLNNKDGNILRFIQECDKPLPEKKVSDEVYDDEPSG
jgi:hypothetical protein